MNASLLNKKLESTNKNKRPAATPRIAKLFGNGTISSLTWLLTEPACDRQAVTQISQWHAVARNAKKKHPLTKPVADKLLKEITSALVTNNGQIVGAGRALKCLAAAQAIRVLIDSCGEEKCLPLVETLLSQTDQLHFAADDHRADRWLEQLLAVELPMTLAYQMPDILVQQDMAQPAADWMATIIQEGLDDDGWPQAELLPMFGPCLASWGRSLRMIRKLNLSFLEDAGAQLEWAVRQLLRLLRPDDTLMFSGPVATPLTPECLALLLRMSGDQEDQKIAASARKVRTSKKSKRKKQSETSSLSEWGKSGILQAGWHRGSPKICFDYSQRSFQMEIGAGQNLLCGHSLPTITFNGSQVVPIDGFEVVCNEFDSDLDYIELQMPLSQAVTLTRQLILSRDEEFLLIADCIVPLAAGKIEYQCDWPLAPKISLLPESETRELYLQTATIQSLVLPLSLPEWKVGSASGRLEPSGRNMRITDSIEGSGIYVPLVFDLNPERARKKRTWRRLTVAEDRQPVRNDQAAAFRFQLNKQQWFFYRTISQAGNRTFLGENFNGEFVISRFDRQGAVAEMLRIE